MRIAPFVLGLLLVCFGAQGRADEGTLYDLPIKLIDQNGNARTLSVFHGHPVIVTMFYGNCPYACPLLIESLRATENALKGKYRHDLRILMVTIDPIRDTPAALAAIAARRHVDTERWTMANAKEDDVRLLAATLGIQYRKLPNGEYNHTSVLTLLSRSGAILKQTALLGKADPDFVAEIEKSAAEAGTR